QPTHFEPGEHEDVFQAESENGGDLTWTLTGNEVTASHDSPACQSITVVKKLNPSSDKGAFNLEIDGKPRGGENPVGDGGTTGTIAVNTGERTVGESAASGTDLKNYDIQIRCTNGAEGTAETLKVTVNKGDAIVCTITNTRKPDEVKPVIPKLECVAFASNAPSVAYWGYSNHNDFPVTIPIGATNRFTPGNEDRGQPTVFEPGRGTGGVATSFGGAAARVWDLAGKNGAAPRPPPTHTAHVA